MADLSKVLGGPWAPPLEKRVTSPEEQLIDAMRGAGLEPPEQIHLDGKLHRFKSGTKGTPDKGGSKPGWYVVYGDGVPAGRFGCWRAGIEVTWRAEIGRKLSPAEEMANARRMSEAKAARDAEQAKQYQVASNTVETIWSSAQGASPEHPYLQRKGIGVHGARVTGDGRLVVPLYGQDGQLSTLQYIAHDGTKLYHPGGQTGGKFWMIGTMDEPGSIYIAEGFATAATIHEATNRPVVVAYSASNLVPVTGSVREMYGQAQDIVIVADNDASGVGQRYAEQASAKHGARMVMPPILGDANDYQQAGNDLKALIVPSKGQDVINKLKVIFGDELSDEYEAPDELVEGLLTIGSSVVIYGDSNSGKTFFALSLAMAVAEGVECYGRRTDPGLVIYLATEAPGSIRSRMQALKKHFGCDLHNLAMVPVPINFHTGDQDAQDLIELVRSVEIAKGKPVRLIIGDTLARMSAGANENSGEDMGPVMARFDQVATATGAAMLIIHHNGKDSAKGARGWSGIRAHIDTEIEVIEKDGVRSANITKQRELPSKGDAIYFKLEVIEMGTTKFGQPATTCVAVPDDDSQNNPPSNKQIKPDENMKLIERGWFDSGAEVRNGNPYISRSAMRDFLIKNGASERTAKNKTEASREGSIIHKLISQESIEPFEHGWIVLDDAHASAMMLARRM